MAKMLDLKRMVAWLGLVMAALLVLSALNASEAHAKKKRHHHRAPVPSINVVQCPNQGNNIECVGTAGPDRLVGKADNFDSMEGGEGDDIFDGKGGSDSYFDRSTKSNDLFLVPAIDFGDLFVEDDGGSQDVLDLSAYKSTDFAWSKFGSNQLLMTGSGTRDVRIFDFFAGNTIDSFKFSDGTFTADQIKSKV